MPRKLKPIDDQKAPLTGTPQCTARSKRSGVRCKNPVVEGKNVCRLHGGKSLGGIMSPMAKNLKWSKYAPKRLYRQYEETVNDPELLSLRHEVGLVDARIGDLLSRVDGGESGALWAAAKETMANFTAAKSAKDAVLMAQYIDELETLINRGLSDHAMWTEIINSIRVRKELVDTERRRLVDMQKVLTAEQATVFAYRLLAIIDENVTDKSVKLKIALGIRALLAKGEKAGDALDNP